ncbi:MAG TPA: hypothetical protein VNT33_04020 [Telluria sp.]|nr:hypothetical protein [Telluria sp.]
MNLQLGLRTLALLALVAGATAVLLNAELVRAPNAAAPAMLLVGHN